MKTSIVGINLIKNYESLHDGNLTKIGLQPKLCPANIVTIGYGHVLRDLNGSFLKGVDGFRRMMELYPDYETITADEANTLLAQDLEKFEDQLNSLNLKLSQNQFDALISFILNCGFGNFLSSTLLRRIKGEKGSVYDAFLMWTKSNGKELLGLKRRRITEAILYIDGELKFNN